MTSRNADRQMPWGSGKGRDAPFHAHSPTLPLISRFTAFFVFYACLPCGTSIAGVPQLSFLAPAIRRVGRSLPILEGLLVFFISHTSAMQMHRYFFYNKLVIKSKKPPETVSFPAALPVSFHGIGTVCRKADILPEVINDIFAKENG